MEASFLDDLSHAYAIKIIGVVPPHDSKSPCPVSRRPLTLAMVTAMMSALHSLFVNYALIDVEHTHSEGYDQGGMVLVKSIHLYTMHLRAGKDTKTMV